MKSGMDPAKVRVPDIFPDTPEVRSDICDYFFEIQRFDQQIGEMLELIEQAGQLDNTLVVITSDNGMPFPRAKANLYDLGSRMPLAIRWPKQVPGGRTVDDFVNLTDLAPTFLEAAGLTPPEAMTGRSLLDLLKSTKSGIVEPGRDAVCTGRERHAWCRIDGKGYPARMIRTRDFLYIRNYEPDRWPAGNYRIVTNEGHYGDIDASPTKDVMIAQKDTNAQPVRTGLREASSGGTLRLPERPVPTPQPGVRPGAHGDPAGAFRSADGTPEGDRRPARDDGRDALGQLALLRQQPVEDLAGTSGRRENGCPGKGTEDNSFRSRCPTVRAGRARGT